jgi:hypothetical protein
MKKDTLQNKRECFLEVLQNPEMVAKNQSFINDLNKKESDS